MSRVSQIVGGLSALAVLTVGASQAQAVSCMGVPAFASCTAYASGASVTFNNAKYTAIAPIPANRDCPPNSPYDPASDNWWTNNGTCDVSSTATATATRTSTATATRTATATATMQVTDSTPPRTTPTPTRTNTPTATPTRTNTPTATRTATATATATTNTGGCPPAFASCTAYASGAQVSFNGQKYHSLAPIPATRDCPPNSPFDPTSDNWWQNDGACTGGTSTPTATPTSTPTSVTPTRGTATATATACGCPANRHKLVGYLHNWDTPTSIQPRNVNAGYDIIILSFADYDGSGNFTFTPAITGMTQASLQSDIQILHGQGRKVLVAGGGALTTPTIDSPSKAANMANSIAAMMDKYGFDGFDIDFENGAVFLAAGDNDVNNPTSPSIVQLISAMKQLKAKKPSAMITMAPIANYIQAAFQFWGGNPNVSNWNGAFLPLAVGLNNAGALDYVWPQYYNEVNIMGLDGNLYGQGSMDNLVAMSEMLMKGFGVQASGGRAELSHFNGLLPAKISIGVPASGNASPGYLGNASLQAAFNYLVGRGGKPGSYTLQGGPYAATSGYMTWSINWDQFDNGGALGNGMGAYLHSLP